MTFVLKHKFAITVAVFAIINAAVLFAIYSYQAGENTVPGDETDYSKIAEEEKDKEVSTKVKNYESYKNEKYHYTVEVPDKWYVVDGVLDPAGAEVDYLQIRALQTKSVPSVEINNQVVQKQVCESIYDHSKSAGAKDFSTSEKEINGIKFKTGSVTFDDPSMDFQENYKEYRYWDVNKNACFIITSHDNLDNDYEDILNKVIESFKIS